MDKRMNRMLKQGISDAVGFVGGALAGYWLAQSMGWDVFATGYGNSSIMGILAIGLGGGGGLHAARIWQKSNLKPDDEE
jgi:hypothetical protein